MGQVKLMTQAEYAKHRGCSGVAVHKAIKAGRISTINDKIDPAVADIQWEKNTRARVTPPKLGDSDNIGAAPTRQEASPGEQGGDGKVEDYWDARSRREKAEAAIAEMKEQEMRGALIRADAVRSALAARISSTRDALLQIPSRLAPVLAAESDIERTSEILEVELRQALAQLGELKTTEVHT